MSRVKHGPRKSGPGPSVGERLAYFRRVVGVSQAQLAEDLEVSPSSVCEWESGKTSPTLENLTRAAEKLGVELRVFFGDIENEPKVAS